MTNPRLRTLEGELNDAHVTIHELRRTLAERTLERDALRTAHQVRPPDWWLDHPSLEYDHGDVCVVAYDDLFDLRNDKRTAEAITLEYRQALIDLRLNANRLCDRNLGGTYEADCRRSIAEADRVVTQHRRLVRFDTGTGPEYTRPEVQMADKTQHDVDSTRAPRTGGDIPKPPDPSKIEQGSKNPDVRDPGDRADKPTPHR